MCSSDLRDVIKEFQEIVKDITSTFLDFDSIVIPEAWIIADKKKRTKAKPKTAGNGEIKEKGDVTGKIATELERYLNGQNCKFVPYVWKGDKLHLTKKLVVYGKDSDKEQLDKFYGFLKNEVTFVILSDRETKVLESYNLTNWMTISKFAEGKSQPYRRAVSTSLIRNLQTEFKYIFSNVNGPHTICTTIRGLKEDVDELNQYHRKHKTSYYMPIEMTNKAIEDGNVDPNIHHVYLRVKKFLSTFRFIETIQSDFSFHNSSVYNSMLEDLCRYNKIRMSIDKYHITEGWLPVDEDGQLSLFVA